ncbi:uncharacterized protein LMH87_007663 [Akanthomyces muscarius]|uniref:MFS transporter n=1 Tax=Akanthomyces muscarius TaxID=2231603 RepID=A0A9W8URA8_AKAMU|nr:uncharacterized protein LMH87_007663 [Akanthomyces muscarius]KAJ4161636.1 hypothetical protein LMH87_007663 [Akanthomyces muscarius]
MSAGDSSPEGSPAPSNAKYRLFVISASLCNFATTGVVICFSVFQDWYQRSLFPSQNSATIALIGSLQLSVFLCVSHVNIPPQKKIMMAGALLCVAAWIWCSLARSIAEIIIAQGLMFAVGAGILHATTTSFGTQYLEGSVLALLIPSGSLFGALFWSVVVKLLTVYAVASAAHRIIAVITASLLSCSLMIMCLCGSSSLPGEPEPAQPKTLCRKLLKVGSSLFLYMGLSMPLTYLAFWGADSALGGICDYLPAVFQGFAVIGHFSSLYLGRWVSSGRLLLVETGVVGLLTLTFPIMVTTVLMGVAAASLGLFTGHILVTEFAKHQLQSGNLVINTALPCLGLLSGGPVCAFIIQASDGGRFGVCFFAGGCLVLSWCLGECLERIYEESGEKLLA